MLELLVAFLIISASTTALMQMQLNGANTERDLLSQIRANLLIGDLRRKLDSVGNPLPSPDISFGQLPAAVIDCRRLFCDPAQLTAFYIAHWKCRLGKWTQTALCDGQFGLHGLLTDGDGQIRRHGSGVDITLRWLNAAGQQQTLTRTHVVL